MYFAGLANFYRDRRTVAIEWLLKARAANPNQPRAYAALAVAYAGNGKLTKAQEYAAQLKTIAPNFSLRNSLESPFPSSPDKYKDQYQGVYLPAAQRAGLPE